MRSLWTVLVFCLVHVTAGGTSRAQAPGDRAGGALPPAALRAIVAHGPWPPPARTDTGNPLSANAEAIALGRRLFFDARMSPSGRVACSSCHRPERGWTDGRARSRGLAEGQRNTPSLYDVRLNTRFGWTGLGVSLWQQSIRPLLDPVEMGSSAAHVASHIATTPDLAALFIAAHGSPSTGVAPQATLEIAAQALAAFQETIGSGRTPFDAWRDALAAGLEASATGYPVGAQRGATLFVGAAGCDRCHAGPSFSDGAMHTSGARSREAIRTPGLRQLARTAPYLNDGSAATVSLAIAAHAITPALGQQQVADLGAFLATLSDTRKPQGRRIVD